MNNINTSMRFLFFIIMTSVVYGDSKTMFIPRLISTDSVFELALTNAQFQKEKNENVVPWDDSNILAFKPFFQRSRSGESLARFFLPHNKACIQFRENGTGDVNPLWFNVIGNNTTCYSSTLCIRPERTSYGMILTWYKDLSEHVNHLWIGINTALVHTVHDMHFKEINRTGLGTIPGYQNAIQAFNSSTWTAGKIASHPLHRTGLDDIQLKLGYDFWQSYSTTLAFYGVSTIPTGSRPQSCFLFEPLVGSKHASLGAGFNMDYENCRNFNIMADLKYRYVFAATQRRSFDLKNGDWSRYLLVVTEKEPFFVYPGINSFTKDVKVTPGHTLQMWSAINYHTCVWNLEAGYNFWFAGKEKLCLLCDTIGLPGNIPIGIFDMQVFTPPVTTAHNAQIQQGVTGFDPVVGDNVFTPTTIADVNICSARNSHMLSNTLYGSCKYQFPCDHHPVFIELSGSYEFGHGCGVLSQYAIWGAITLLF